MPTTAPIAPPAHVRRVTGLTITQPIPFKTRGNSGRPGFAVRGVYQLEDGGTSPTVLFSERKKDIPQRIERTQASITANQLTLEGDFIIHRFTIC